jgi:hypothetical protein
LCRPLGLQMKTPKRRVHQQREFVQGRLYRKYSFQATLPHLILFVPLHVHSQKPYQCTKQASYRCIGARKCAFEALQMSMKLGTSIVIDILHCNLLCSDLTLRGIVIRTRPWRSTTNVQRANHSTLHCIFLASSEYFICIWVLSSSRRRSRSSLASNQDKQP